MLVLKVQGSELPHNGEQEEELITFTKKRKKLILLLLKFSQSLN